MADLNGFDANEVEPATGFSPVPAGDYSAIIAKSEMKSTKAGTGHYLELTFQIIEGDHNTRLLWARLNLDNPSEVAVQIARGELSSICRAIGIMQPKDSMELHDLPMTITVICKKREDTGEMTNEIKKYKKSDAAQPPQAATGAPPWART